MQKVLFITRKWPPAVGGMETYSVELARELAKSCDLQVHALPGQKNGKPPKLWRLAIFMFSSIVEILRRRQDVIHIGDLVMWPLSAVAALVRPSAPVVITAYGLDILYGEKPGLGPAIYRLYLSLGVALVGRRTRVIAISSATADLCRSKGFVNVSVVKLGVNLSERSPVEALDVKPYVLFVGRLVERKGASWFAEQVLPLLDEEIKFVVVGKPWDEPELNSILNNPRAIYEGVLSNEEIAKLRRSAIAIVMPNISTGGQDMEGFGLTALEAAADGGILLASGIEGIVDAVVDGVTGFLLPERNASKWSEKINELSVWHERKREDFTRHAIEVIRNEYSWERVSVNTKNVYDIV